VGSIPSGFSKCEKHLSEFPCEYFDDKEMIQKVGFTGLKSVLSNEIVRASLGIRAYTS